MKNYYALDIGKLVSAILIIAIHTQPLYRYSQTLNFILCEMIARLGVPFFFICSGFFLFRNQPGKEKLLSWSWRIFLMYGIWSVVYFGMFVGLHDGTVSGMKILRFILKSFWMGSNYHLWFFPALLYAGIGCWVLRSFWSWKWVLLCALLLYLWGCLGTSWYSLSTFLPPIQSMMDGYLAILTTTRDGICFGLLGVTLGGISTTLPTLSRRNAAGLVVCAFFFWILEYLLLNSYGVVRSYDISLFLMPTAWSLFLWLRTFQGETRLLFPWFRSLSILIYVIQGIPLILLPRLPGFPDGRQWWFFGTLICCVLGGVVLLALSRLRGGRWLRYCY